MKDIFLNEFKGYFRNKLFFSLGVFFFFFLSIVTYFSILQNEEQLIAQKNAHEYIRAQWDDMQASNPHSAAHYGTYAFKPLSVLNSIVEQLTLLEISLRIIAADEKEEEDEKSFIIKLRKSIKLSDNMIKQRFGNIDYLEVSEFQSFSPLDDLSQANSKGKK